MVETVFENEFFNLYKDNRGKFWLWDELEEQNHAIRATSEVGAYKQAVSGLIQSRSRVLEERNKLSAIINRVRDFFEDFEDE
tara:strand:- start:2446 stop:2691 length:246 start_codon:yes stop_codon:yes gene_type:complete